MPYFPKMPPKKLMILQKNSTRKWNASLAFVMGTCADSALYGVAPPSVAVPITVPLTVPASA